MNRTFLPLLTMISVATYIVIRSDRRPDRHADARDLAYETWLRYDDHPPRPSVFNAWRRGFGESALIRAIHDVARRNVLDSRLINRVLYLRAQDCYMLVDAA